MADFRALCAEILQTLDQYEDGQRVDCDAWRETARSALAQPKPQEPTKAELRQVFDDQSGYVNDEQVMWWADFHKAARAVLKQYATH
jgi:hypothetical protein